MLDKTKLLTMPLGYSSVKTITLSTGSSVSSLIDLRVAHYGGSYDYEDNESQLGLTFNRRFLMWRVADDILEIEERSLDTDLHDNSVRFNFKNDIIMSGVTIASASHRIYILVPTFSVAQRICIPYHIVTAGAQYSRFSVSDMGMSYGSGPQISVLASLDVNSISNPKDCFALQIGTRFAIPHTAAAALSSSEEALFAYGLADGSILLITMPAYDEGGPTTQECLSQASTVRRLLSGFMSPFSRGDTLAHSSATSIALQVSANDVFLYVTASDQKLHCWSCRKKELISTLDITPENAPRPPASSYIARDTWRVKAATDKESPFLVLFTCTEGLSRFFILCFSKQGLIKVMEFDAPEADLLDFTLSEHGLYTLWSENGTTIIRWKELHLSSLENLKHSHWQLDVLSAEHLYVDLEESDFDDSQTMVSAIFDSRIFCFDVVVKAVKVCSKNLIMVSSVLGWNRLKTDFESFVSRLPQTETPSLHRGAAMSRSTFLRSVWSCCLQYDQECRKPVALLHCPALALHGIILTKKMAVLSDVTATVTNLLAAEEGIPAALRLNITDCMTKILRIYLAVPHLQRAFDSKIFGHNRSVWTSLQEQLREALASQESSDAQKSLSRAELALGATLEAILKYLDRSDKIIIDTTAVGRGGGDSKLGVQGSFRGEFGATLLSTAVDKALLECCELAKVSLILIAFCDHYKYKLKLPSATWSFIDSQCIPKLLDLLQFYVVLRWAFAYPIEIYGANEAAGKRTFLLDQLINHPVGDKIRNYWKRFHAHSDIRRGIGSITQATIDAFWPSNNFVAIFDYLAETEQYDCLLELCERLDSRCEELKFSRIFAQGYALLHLGHLKEALGKFRVAYEGIERGDRLLVQQLSASAGSNQDIPTPVLYYLKVAEMYEKKGQSEYAIETCENFLRKTAAMDASFLPIFNLMFKHYLKLKRYDDTFSTIKRMESDRNAQAACLRQFIFYLQEENLLGKLNEYDFGDLESEFLTIVEARARAVDLTADNYYDFLYAFFISRSNYRKAATYSYELAMRFRKEVPGVESLRRQVHALAASLHTLSLERNGTSIDRPDFELSGMEYSGASPKRASDGEEKEYIPKGLSKYVSQKEIECEYILAKGNLALAERTGSLIAPLPPNELAKSLMQYNFFDLTVNLSVLYELSLADIIDLLTLRCVQSDKPRSSTGLDEKYWAWLIENKDICSTVTDSRSQNYAWSMLQAYLKQLSKVTPASPLYVAAARRFLSLSQAIPPWFLQEFKKVDFPELLRLLIEYDLLAEAQHSICEYLDAALGIGAEEFNMMETLTVGKHAPVWLPYSSIDMLLSILSEKRQDVESGKLRNELESKLKQYFNQLDVQMKLVRRK